MAYMGSPLMQGAAAAYGREPPNSNYFSRPLDAALPLGRHDGLYADGLYGAQRRIGGNGVSAHYGEQLLEPVQAFAVAHPQSPVKELVPVIEAAEFTLRSQMEENDKLKHTIRGLQKELQTRMLENEHLRSALKDGHQDIQSNPLEQQLGSLQIEDRLSGQPSAIDGGSDRLLQPSSQAQPSRSISVLKDGQMPSMQSALSQARVGSHQVNSVADQSRTQKQVQLPSQSHLDNGNVSHLSSPSSKSTSPKRGPRGTDLDMRLQLDGPRQHAPNTSNNNSYQQQEVMLRSSRMLEEESLYLRNRLVESSIKEAHMLREMRVLQRHLAELRVAYDQQQQGLADAASKALSYRHDVLEENVRLNCALQVAEQEKAIYVSSLLPLLAEFELQPAPDAHSIVAAIKVLVQYLKAKLNPNEVKIKDPRYYGPSWQPYFNPVTSPYIPNSGISQPPPLSNGHGLEIVAQQQYSVLQRPASPSSPINIIAPGWQQPGMNSHIANENERFQQVAYDRQLLPAQVSGYSTEKQEPRLNGQRLEESDLAPKSSEDLSDSEAEEPLNQGNSSAMEHERPEQSVVPHLPPLNEEPLSEDKDPLPAVSGLRIMGEAVLGGRLTACGHSIKGTSVCMFQWVRYYQDGTEVAIEGAGQPAYIITADDCDTIIAIHCVPMDDRQRKGDLVTVYANDQNYIRCDQMMQDEIDNHLANGLVSFSVSLVVEGVSEEPGTLTLKRSSYELRQSNGRKPVVNEKYSLGVDVRIPAGHYHQCAIFSSDSRVHYVNLPDSRVRDTVVLTMRHFLKAALDRKKPKRTLPWLSKIVQ